AVASCAPQTAARPGRRAAPEVASPLLARPLVSADLYACGRRGGGHELEPACRAVGREDALAAAEHDRLDHQVQLVDEVRLEQRPNELRAAHDVHVATRSLVQRSHGPEEVGAADQ